MKYPILPIQWALSRKDYPSLQGRTGESSPMMSDASEKSRGGFHVKHGRAAILGVISQISVARCHLEDVERA